MSVFATASSLPLRDGWSRLAGEPFDILVVGGGIHGAGVARDAALRGLRVALIERDDWASGTSSRSSKLMHGGLRYLRQGRWRMVHEALAERDLHLKLAPGHVRPLRFLVPPAPRGATPRWMVRAGIGLYGLLSRAPRASRFWDAEPSYMDATTDDARFCLDLVLDARREGAVACNYTEWLEWARDGERIAGARVRDRVSGKETWIEARVLVNAAGPWTDVVAPPGGAAGSRLRLTRGTHVVLDRQADDAARLFFSAADGRVLFLLPYEGGCSLLGTTDIDEAVPVKDPIPSLDEVAYLREAFARQFPDWRHWKAVGLQCGLRPLLAAEGDPSAVSREVRIDAHPGSPVISIYGGKYTTYRRVAERVVDQAMAWLDREPKTHPTRTRPVPPPPTEDTQGRLRRGFSEEDAVRLEDVLLRRTSLGHRGLADPAMVEQASRLWRMRWGMDESEARTEAEAFLDLQRRRLAPLAAWGVDPLPGPP